MLNIGITGQSGFVGTHLFNRLANLPAVYKCIPFEDCFFEDDQKLCNFVKQCDVIIHLAAMMRSPREAVVYATNIRLVNQLLAACDYETVAPAILFASSIQENQENEYGRSKIDGQNIIKEWAKEHNTGFLTMVFPNVTTQV